MPCTNPMVRYYGHFGAWGGACTTHNSHAGTHTTILGKIKRCQVGAWGARAHKHHMGGHGCPSGPPLLAPLCSRPQNAPWHLGWGTSTPHHHHPLLLNFKKVCTWCPRPMVPQWVPWGHGKMHKHYPMPCHGHGALGCHGVALALPWGPGTTTTQRW